jgi:hypothetical protein
MKECDTFPSWLFNVAVAYSIMKVGQSHEIMESKGTELLHVYAIGDNLRWI